MIKAGLAHVWDEIPEGRKLLIRAYYKQQNIMTAWENYQVEKK